MKDSDTDAVVRKPSIWRQKPFLALWGSESFNSLALLLMQVTIMVKVYEETNSLLGSASVLAIRAFCGFLGGMTGSYFIDRFHLVRLLKFLNRLRLLLSVVMGALVLLGVPLLYILLLYYLFTLIASWYGPCRFALISFVVDRDEYIQARTSITLVNQLISTAGWGIGGLLTIYVSFPALIWTTCAFFLMSSVLNAQIAVKSEIPPEETNKTKRESSLKLLLATPVIRLITVIEALEGLANVVWSSAFLLTFTHLVLNKGNEWWGYLNASYFVGAILGSSFVLLFSRLFQNKMGTLVTLGATFMGVLTLLFTVIPIAPLSVLLCVVMGPFYQARDTGLSAIFIESVDPAKRASVNAAKNALLSPWNAVTFVIMAYIAEVSSITAVYWIAGALYLVVAALIFMQPAVRKYSYSNNTSA